MAKTKAAHLADPLGWSHECGHWPAYLPPGVIRIGFQYESEKVVKFEK